MDILNQMEEKLINKEIYKYQKLYMQRLKINDPEAFKKIKQARYEYYKEWRARNPDYNRKWLRKYYKKYPEKFKGYQRKFWLKKALTSKGD